MEEEKSEVWVVLHPPKWVRHASTVWIDEANDGFVSYVAHTKSLLVRKNKASEWNMEYVDPALSNTILRGILAEFAVPVELWEKDLK